MFTPACKDRFIDSVNMLDDISTQLISNNVAAAMSSLHAHLCSYRSKFDGLAWKRFCDDTFLTHPVRQLIHEDPFTRRAFEKPRGYPGDAVMLDFLYEYNSLGDETSVLGKAVYDWEFYTQSSRSVRLRRDILADLIDETARAHRPARILSVACGHARELGISRTIAEALEVDFTAFDQDEDSLKTLRAGCGSTSVNTVHGSVRAILTGRTKFTGMNFVYSAGLYDYLPQPVATRLTSKLFNMLQPGGKLVLVNFTPDLLDAACLEAFAQWWLTYRSEQDMQNLLAETPSSDIAAVRTFCAGNRSLAFLEVVRK